MITNILLISIGLILIIISGMFDAQRDYAKSNIKDKVNQNLYRIYSTYYYSGTGSIGWKWKWKTQKNGDVFWYFDSNGDEITKEEFYKSDENIKKQIPAFFLSTTSNVWITDWFHFAKRFQIIFLITGLILLAFVNPFLILTYETLNHIGFELMVKKNKFAVILMYQFEKLGIYIWEKVMLKYNKDFFETIFNV